MSEQFSADEFAKKILSHWELIKEHSPNIMKGVYEYGCFSTNDNAERFLEQFDVSVQPGDIIDKLFIRGKYDIDIQVWDNYRLKEASKLTGILESLAEWSDLISDGQDLDYKACLLMRLDDTFVICMRREFFRFKFEGEEGTAKTEKFEPRLRLEIVLTTKSDEIDWSAVNLYD